MGLYESAIEKVAPAYKEWDDKSREACTEVDEAHSLGFSQGLVEAISLLFDVEFWDVECDLSEKGKE